MDVERTIADLWKELFGLAEVGRDDNFFALGGDSLLAMNLTGRISERLDVEFSPVMLFLNPTPRLSAECINSLDAPE